MKETQSKKRVVINNYAKFLNGTEEELSPEAAIRFEGETGVYIVQMTKDGLRVYKPGANQVGDDQISIHPRVRNVIIIK